MMSATPQTDVFQQSVRAMMPDINAFIHAFSTLHVAQTEGHTSPANLLEYHINFKVYFSKKRYGVLETRSYM